jgi:hypothetical protein
VKIISEINKKRLSAKAIIFINIQKRNKTFFCENYFRNRQKNRLSDSKQLKLSFSLLFNNEIKHSFIAKIISEIDNNRICACKQH